MELNLNYFEINVLTSYIIEGFTKVWVAMKTVFFPCIICIMIWFWQRVHQLQRSPVLIEYMLLYLGGALSLLNRKIKYNSICLVGYFTYNFVFSSVGVPDVGFRYAVHAFG